MGAARRHRQRDRAGRVPDRPERGAARRAARTGVPDADADEALRASSKSWSAPRSTSPPTRRRSSPVSCWPSTAGSSRAGSTSESRARHQRARQRGDRARGARAGRSLELRPACDGVARTDPARPQGRAVRDRRRRGGGQVRQPDRHRRRRDIAAGAHVHTHNVASSRGRGDLRVGRQSELRGWQSRRDVNADPTIRRAPMPRIAAARFPRLPPSGRPRRHAQPRARRADGDLLVGRRRARRRGRGAGRRGAAAPRRAAASSGPTCG